MSCIYLISPAEMYLHMCVIYNLDLSALSFFCWFFYVLSQITKNSLNLTLFSHRSCSYRYLVSLLPLCTVSTSVYFVSIRHGALEGGLNVPYGHSLWDDEKMGHRPRVQFPVLSSYTKLHNTSCTRIIRYFAIV